MKFTWTWKFTFTWLEVVDASTSRHWPWSFWYVLFILTCVLYVRSFRGWRIHNLHQKCHRECLQWPESFSTVLTWVSSHTTVLVKVCWLLCGTRSRRGNKTSHYGPNRTVTHLNMYKLIYMCVFMCDCMCVYFCLLLGIYLVSWCCVSK